MVNLMRAATTLSEHQNCKTHKLSSERLAAFLAKEARVNVQQQLLPVVQKKKKHDRGVTTYHKSRKQTTHKKNARCSPLDVTSSMSRRPTGTCT